MAFAPAQAELSETHDVGRRSVSDWLLTFGADAAEIPSRTLSGDSAPWRPKEHGGSGQFLVRPPSPQWKGRTLLGCASRPWRLYFWGELYGLSSGEDISDVLLDVVCGRRPAAALNGRFLLWAWEERLRRWHLWTDRFGTLHAYYAHSGNRGAIGTFFAAVSAAASRRELDWPALTAFFALGSFPRDRTYFEDVRVCRPASHYVFDEHGALLHHERYWEWRHEISRGRSPSDTVDEFAELLREIVSEHVRGRAALPISGGMDSRTLVAAVTRPAAPNTEAPSLSAYSYGYSPGSVETAIAREVAEARKIHFQPFTIGPYLFDAIYDVTACVEGFQDVTHSRQAAVTEHLRGYDCIIGGHQGSMWFEDMQLKLAENERPNEARFLDVLLEKMNRPGGEWPVKHLCEPRLGSARAAEILRDFVQEDCQSVAHIEDPEFRTKAFETDQWSFRWTVASLRMFETAALVRLPYFDARMADFVCTVPSNFIRNKQLQIDYLKRYAPDLARIKWQQAGTDLYRSHRSRGMAASPASIPQSVAPNVAAHDAGSATGRCSS
jgi:asparagine synthase (glutamine-hydrolysing)